MKEEITKSLHVLLQRKIILYPTDTVWGLGCDATSDEAVRKIYQLKHREESKSLVILISSLEMLHQYIPEIPDGALKILKETNKPTTIIYSNPKGLAQNTVASDNTVAIRIPNHQFCLKLIRALGKPIVSTSANMSGNPTPKSFSKIDQAILDGVDYVVNLERDKITEKSSTILKLKDNEVQVIRV